MIQNFVSKSNYTEISDPRTNKNESKIKCSLQECVMHNVHKPHTYCKACISHSQDSTSNKLIDKKDTQVTQPKKKKAYVS